MGWRFGYIRSCNSALEVFGEDGINLLKPTGYVMDQQV